VELHAPSISAADGGSDGFNVCKETQYPLNRRLDGLHIWGHLKIIAVYSHKKNLFELYDISVPTAHFLRKSDEDVFRYKYILADDFENVLVIYGHTRFSYRVFIKFSLICI
jgi:hypothetical protein